MKMTHEQITPDHVGRTVWVNENETAVIIGVQGGDITIMYDNGDHDVYGEDTLLIKSPLAPGRVALVRCTGPAQGLQDDTA